ncbi:hypothetical protein [Streptomyces sp. bgisy032]|uniref:hypothetical protein n=1 Tax=Streptomyces sp. bgisy032 TaxID=3413773 RepID=UPI003D72DFD7
MAFSPDGTRVAVAGAAFVTRLLNADDLSDAPAGYPALRVPEGRLGPRATARPRASRGSAPLGHSP